MARTPRYFATQALRIALSRRRRAGEPQYVTAKHLRFEHTRLSHIAIGAVGVREDDERIQRLCEYLGIPFNEAFEQRASDLEAAHA